MRGVYLACPGCDGPMSAVTIADAGLTVPVCELCRGVWFDWFDGEASGLALGFDTHAVATPPTRPAGRCPRDGDQLVEQPYLDAGPEVGRCPTCMGLFAPRAKIAALQAFHSRIPARAPEPIERTSLLARLWHAFVE